MNNIFDLFLKYKMLNPEVISLVQEYCKKWNLSGYHGLLETNLFSESELADKLAFLLKMDRVYAIYPADHWQKAFDFLPFSLAYEWACFPIVVHHPKPLFEVVLADPTRRDRIDWLRKKANNQLLLAVGEHRDILRAVREFYPISEQLPNLKRREPSFDDTDTPA